MSMLAAPTGSNFGEVFTRRWVAEVMLDLVGYTVDRDLAALRLVEPACGMGALLVPSVERLAASAVARGRLVDEGLSQAIQAYDVQKCNVDLCRDAVVAALLPFGVDSETAEGLARHWVRDADYLLSACAEPDLLQQDSGPDADFVIGNPPCIRFEKIDDAVHAQYRARWPTMSGRADVYVGFYERALRSLKPGGRLAFICADRWMRNQYGAALRRLVAREYCVEAVWSLHSVDVFETSVAAYPAITVIGRRVQSEVVVADTTCQFTEVAARELASWTLRGGGAEQAGVGYQAYRVPCWFSGDEMWPTCSPSRMSLIKHLNDNFVPLHNPAAGTRVGIGVTTGADKIYVRHEDDPELIGVENDRLLPLSTACDMRTGTFEWGRRYLVNPWNQAGDLVDLSKYPGLSAYFVRHHSRLVERHTAKANPRSWYRTIDKVNHDLLTREKLLIQDLQTSLSPVLENQGCYPHHNLYYVVSTQWDMDVLGGLLLSGVAQAFIEAYSVRMRGNTLRFQSQYLKKIRVPEPAKISEHTKQALRDAFLRRDVLAATTASLSAYGLRTEDLLEGRTGRAASRSA